MRRLAAVILGFVVLFAANSSPRAGEKKGDQSVPPALNFTMKGLDGKDVDLSKYQGKVVLVVNVASKCGFTPQYKGLQSLHDRYASEGLVVLGVPANNFGKQEPGTNEEIAKFCDSKYSVKFDMLAKVSVKGDDECPLYKYLTSKETDPKFAGDIKWNFTKFLINRKGDVVGRFEPKVDPQSDELMKAIEVELEKKK
ncbi:MAG TPA: glutathione peroxidase [Gemmataceae bacterium]